MAPLKERAIILQGSQEFSEYLGEDIMLKPTKKLTS